MFKVHNYTLAHEQKKVAVNMNDASNELSSNLGD